PAGGGTRRCSSSTRPRPTSSSRRSRSSRLEARFERGVVEERFKETSAEFLGSFLRRIQDCVGRLSEDEVWWRPNPAVNSAGNLLLHLHGNLSQWILEGLGGVPYERHRDREFAEQGPMPRAQLLASLERAVVECQRVIRALSADDLLRPREI